MKEPIYQNVFRCDLISSVDGFLPVRDVLKYEMFGDEGDKGFRNFEGVISNLEEIFNIKIKKSYFEPLSFEDLKSDEDARFTFVDRLIEFLIKECGMSKEYFNYGIWACDCLEDVVDSYNVNIEDVSKYKIKGVKLQDLGEEGSLYGCKNYPEVLDESTKISMNFNEEDFAQLYEECVTAGGMGGCINNFVPQNVLTVTDTKLGAIAPGSARGKFVKDVKDCDFENDTMKVYKKSTGKGDAITGTGIVYAKGKKMSESVEADDEDKECHGYECCNCGADCTDYGVMINGDLYCKDCAEHEMDDTCDTEDDSEETCPRCGDKYDLNDPESFGIAKGRLWCAKCAKKMKETE